MKRMLQILLVCMVLLWITGCSSNKQTNTELVEVYYINSKTEGLAAEPYQLKETVLNMQIKELLEEVRRKPDNAVYKSVLPEKSAISYAINKQGNLIINYDESFNQLTDISKIVSSAAVVKTLSQLDGVDDIQFSVNGQPMKNSNGDVIVPLSSDDFIDNTETNMSYKIKLYFANKEGNALIEEVSDINYSGTASIEEQVVQRLINGPKNEELFPTIPKGTKLLNISKADGICTVNFNEKFLDKIPNVNEEIAIYSVVNTLVELADVNKVQFTINGGIQKKYMEIVPFDLTFEAKLNYIQDPN